MSAEALVISLCFLFVGLKGGKHERMNRASVLCDERREADPRPVASAPPAPLAARRRDGQHGPGALGAPGGDPLGSLSMTRGGTLSPENPPTCHTPVEGGNCPISPLFRPPVRKFLIIFRRRTMEKKTLLTP